MWIPICYILSFWKQNLLFQFIYLGQAAYWVKWFFKCFLEGVRLNYVMLLFISLSQLTYRKSLWDIFFVWRFFWLFSHWLVKNLFWKVLTRRLHVIIIFTWYPFILFILSKSFFQYWLIKIFVIFMILIFIMIPSLNYTKFL